MYHVNMVLEQIHRFITATQLADKTKEVYTYFLFMFAQWYRNKYPEKPFAEATPEDVSEWFASKKWRSTTKYSAAAALKRFYTFAFSDQHPITRIKVRRIEAGPQRTLDRSELEAVLSSFDTTTDKGIRDLAIFTLMIDTGIRSNELCSLEMQYLSMRKHTIKVKQKGGEWGDKMFFDYTASCLAAWLAIRPMLALDGVSQVFVAIKGKKPGYGITHSTLKYICETVEKVANLDHFSPHSTRRTFATLATEEGAPTRMVQLAGGWKSIRMVERYTRNLSLDNMKKYSPINSVMGLSEVQELSKNPEFSKKRDNKRG